MAQVQLPTRVNKDLQGWPEGVNSYLDPQLIKDSQVRWAENAVNKGGLWQTRPGYKTILSLCTTPGSTLHDWWVAQGEPMIHPQCFTVFKPTGDTAYAVFAIYGSVFYSKFTPSGGLTQPQQITTLSFDQTVAQITVVKATQSASLVNGRVAVVPPQDVLFFQDGTSRCGYWNGTTGGHLNPEKNWTSDSFGNTLYTAGYNETPIGKWMAWSGNRLWVFRGTQGFASDINNPFSFTEETVLTQVPSFNFPGEVTACIDRGTSGVQQDMLFVFTQNRTIVLRSGVQDRTTWISTADFQRTIFNGVGCVAGKSPICHQGLLYWYSQDGAVSFDSTGTTYASQSLPACDYEMAYSKLRMSPDKSTICAGIHSSYVLWSVPVGPVTNGRCYNAHTQVMDRMVVPVPPPAYWGSVSPYGVTSWQGVWTGIRPIEWSTEVIGGQLKTYCLSMDFDGVPRIWEAFQGNRADNGHPISWLIETKTHPVTESPFLYNRFGHFKLLFQQIKGNLNVRGYYRGLRGQYHQLMNTFVTSTPGSVLLPISEYSPIHSGTETRSFSKQTREVESSSSLDPTGAPNQATDVETPHVADAIDRAFSLLLRMDGVGALLAYRVATDRWQQNNESAQQDPETGFHILPEASPPELLYPGTTPPDYILPDSPTMEALTPYQPNYVAEHYVAPVDPCA